MERSLLVKEVLACIAQINVGAKYLMIKENMKKIYSHGEISFVTIDKLPEGLEEAKTNVFAKGKTGNSHTFEGGKIYLKNEGQFVVGYFEAIGTKLYHPEHSQKGAELPDGVYQIKRQNEFTPEGLVPVID